MERFTVSVELTPDGEIVNHKNEKYDLYKVSICRDELTIEIPGIKDILKDLSNANSNSKLLDKYLEENRKLQKEVKDLNKKVTTLTNTINSKIALISQNKALLKKDEEIFKVLLTVLDDGTPNSHFINGIIADINKAITRSI